MQARPDLIVDGKAYDFKTTDDSLAGNRHQLLVIDDIYAVDRFMEGHDVVLTESRQDILYRRITNEFKIQIEDMVSNASIRKPYRPVDYYSTKSGKARAKLLKKRAKDKANRKRSRR